MANDRPIHPIPQSIPLPPSEPSISQAFPCPLYLQSAPSTLSTPSTSPIPYSLKSSVFGESEEDTEEELDALLEQIELQRDYYHTCINGGY